MLGQKLGLWSLGLKRGTGLHQLGFFINSLFTFGSPSTVSQGLAQQPRVGHGVWYTAGI